jgi:hypothetical protein
MIKNKKYLCTCALVGAIVSSSVLGVIPVQAATINKPAKMGSTELKGIAWKEPNATMNCDAGLYSSSSFTESSKIMDLSQDDQITVLYDHGSYSFVQYHSMQGFVYNDQFDFN